MNRDNIELLIVVSIAAVLLVSIMYFFALAGEPSANWLVCQKLNLCG